MADFLVQLAGNDNARRILKRLGLPIALPQPLERRTGSWKNDELHARTWRVFGSAGSSLAMPLAKALVRSGGEVLHATELSTFTDVAEAFGGRAEALPDDERRDLSGIVLDATHVSEPDHLDALYDIFHLHLPMVARGGRVLVLARPPSSTDAPGCQAARQALEGFVRSVAKEVGGKGITANLLWVTPAGDGAIEGPVRWFLGDGASFVTAQAITLGGGDASGPFPWSSPLTHKVALVTGAARGIGAATARVLAREGATVLLVDRPSDDDALETLAEELGGRAVRLDITAEGAGSLLAREASQAGGLDILIHNAGVTRDRTIGRMPEADWNLVLEVNLKAIERLTRALSPEMREQGRIITLASIAGIAGNRGQTNYAATKAGVIGLMRGYAEVLRDRGITANCIAPGFIETDMTAKVPTVIREAGRRLSALGQGGLPEDVAEAITFLASPGAFGINGQVLRVCGGNFLGA